MPLINTSTFSNLLGSNDRPAQRKALVTPFTEFDGKPEDVLQHVARFNQRCKETGVTEDFNFIISENEPPSDVDLTDPSQKTAWFSDSRRFNYGNLLQDPSQATLEKVQAARDRVRNQVEKFTSVPDPDKMPLSSKALVSFQNREWIYVLLMNVWSITMQAIMNRYQEAHEQDGVVLWFCFLQEFSGTTTANIIQANAMLLDAKLQLRLFRNDILNFTNYVRVPIRCLLKAKEQPSCQNFISVFHACMDAPNDEFKSYVTTLYTDYRNDGPTKSLSMLQLLDKLDIEYKRIHTLGRWEKQKDPELLALTATISALQAELSSVKTNYAMLSKATNLNQPNPTPPTPQLKIEKPPPRQSGTPEIVEFKGFTWKWCDKCFNGSWNRTHVTADHQPGIGKRNRRRQQQSGATTPQANLATPTTTVQPPPEAPTPSNDSAVTTSLQSNIASSTTLDFM
jgi:hypothetical protein